MSGYVEGGWVIDTIQFLETSRMVYSFHYVWWSWCLVYTRFQQSAWSPGIILISSRSSIMGSSSSRGRGAAAVVAAAAAAAAASHIRNRRRNIIITVYVSHRSLSAATSRLEMQQRGTRLLRLRFRLQRPLWKQDRGWTMQLQPPRRISAVRIKKEEFSSIMKAFIWRTIPGVSREIDR